MVPGKRMQARTSLSGLYQNSTRIRFGGGRKEDVPREGSQTVPNSRRAVAVADGEPAEVVGLPAVVGGIPPLGLAPVVVFQHAADGVENGSFREAGLGGREPAGPGHDPGGLLLGGAELEFDSEFEREHPGGQACQPL